MKIAQAIEAESVTVKNIRNQLVYPHIVGLTN